MTTWKIKTENRVGITHDVIECFLSNRIDIIRMEVKPHWIFVRFPEIEDRLLHTALSTVKEIGGVQEIHRISSLPSEVRENQMDTILATISEGILLVDHNHRLQSINRAALNMLNLKTRPPLGKPIHEVLHGYSREIESYVDLGMETHNVPLTLSVRDKGSDKFIASFLPIQTNNQQGRQELILVLKDMKQIQELIRSVKQKGMLLFEDIIHRSKVMRSCIEISKRVARSKATVLLQGESGTGKELFARAIHYESLRGRGPFVPINCAAIPDHLLESELFGYEEGSFTGASKGGKQGLMEEAHGGTLFLDEIGELPLRLQAKLLRALDEKTIRRVGGNKSTVIDIRIVAATNRDLSAMVSQGEFREDLYYRLNVIPILVPALRERNGDIPLLVEYFLNKICTELKRTPLTISNYALQALCSYHWPGNVRELQNVVERAVYLSSETESQIQDVQLDRSASSSSSSHQALTLKDRIEQHEINIIKEALHIHRTARRTAIELGLSHTALLKKMKKYGISNSN